MRRGHHVTRRGGCVTVVVLKSVRAPHPRRAQRATPPPQKERRADGHAGRRDRIQKEAELFLSSFSSTASSFLFSVNW